MTATQMEDEIGTVNQIARQKLIIADNYET